jgi:hypothetical protein
LKFSASSKLGVKLLLTALALPLGLALFAAAPAVANEDRENRDRVAGLVSEIQKRMGVAVPMTGSSIPPVVVHDHTGLVTSQTPVNIAEIEITTLTPADKFAYAITPLIVVLAMGSVLLVWVGLAQKVSQDAV